MLMTMQEEYHRLCEPMPNPERFEVSFKLKAFVFIAEYRKVGARTIYAMTRFTLALLTRNSMLRST